MEIFFGLANIFILNPPFIHVSVDKSEHPKCELISKFDDKKFEFFTVPNTVLDE